MGFTSMSITTSIITITNTKMTMTTATHTNTSTLTRTMLGGEVMRRITLTLSCQKETQSLASIAPFLVSEWSRCQGGPETQMMIGTSSRLIKRALALQTIMISSTMPGNKSKIVHIIFAMMLQIQSFEFAKKK